MKIFGSTPHPEVVHNAAPVMPFPSAVQGVPALPADALKGLQLSGNLERDTFTRSTPPKADTPFMPPQRALWQITAMTPSGLRAQIAQKMASGKQQDLADVASWLSVAQQHNKIQYAKRPDAELNFGKYLREGMEALKINDLPLSTVSLNRARRQIHDFHGLGGPPVKQVSPPEHNPFMLHY